MTPIVDGQHFAYNKAGMSAARKARQRVHTSDGFMLGKSMAGKVTSKLAPKMAKLDAMSASTKASDALRKATSRML